MCDATILPATVHPGNNAPIGKIVTLVYFMYSVYSIDTINIGPQYILQGEYTLKYILERKVYLRES